MKKSVLLITIDCLRQDHVGHYGYSRDTTPNIDKFASLQNTVCFSSAYSNGPGTRWALKSLFMSMYPLQISGTGLPEKEGIVLAELFQNAGYKTGAFANNGFLTRDYNYHRGFDTFLDVPFWTDNKSKTDKLASRISKRIKKYKKAFQFLRNIYSKIKGIDAPHLASAVSGSSDKQVVAEAVNWIQKQKQSGSPFFAWVHFMNAHTPYIIEKKHAQVLGLDINNLSKTPKDFVDKEESLSQKAIDSYDVAIRSVDEHVGQLLTAVDDDTVVVITSDHGEEFGEHGSFHTASVYQNMAKVPLIIRDSDLKNKTNHKAAQHIDVMPTLAAISGLPISSNWVGEDLTKPIASANNSVFLGIDSENGSKAALLHFPWKLIWDMDADKCELYNLEKDPKEKKNIDSQEEIKHKLKTDLLAHYDFVKSKKIDGAKPAFHKGKQDLNEEVRKRLKALGYID